MLDLVSYQAQLYRNNLKGRDFGQEAAQIFAFGANCIAREQDVSENQKDAAKLTPLKTDSSGCFGIALINAIQPFVTVHNLPTLPPEKAANLEIVQCLGFELDELDG